MGKWFIAFIITYVCVGMSFVRLTDFLIAIATDSPIQWHASTSAAMFLLTFIIAEQWSDRVIAIVNALDAWIHKRVMNPVFAWMQRWLHVNRFDLLRYGLVVNVVLPALVMLEAVHDVSIGKSSGIVMILITMLYVSDIVSAGFGNLWSALKNASERFEHGQFTAAEPVLVNFCRGRTQMRKIWTIFIYAEFQYTLYPRYVGEHWSSEVMYTLMMIGFWLFAHLYDSNDIDPRDRTYLLGPQDQEAS
ncbi:MAG: hypothetical protein UY72_C0036G0010 [Candidatus Uhrbacteria bacterium GW2011_GWD2_52_7]|uniref:Uncharacterized protein n=1 Tax=Candidatus Uhrbacteria bacterium GW2011_GWD2_52_7 TaxID=1618989 RepID=A0A0G1XEJ4_9BACT|nr:MAG: hypothetical protein UY72_C0036G0010 [Candidatus Uhrbacteria bacterium GW2011_GWD2_52_7]